MVGAGGPRLRTLDGCVTWLVVAGYPARPTDVTASSLLVGGLVQWCRPKVRKQAAHPGRKARVVASVQEDNAVWPR